MPALKRAINSVPSDTVLARRKCHRRHGASSDVPPGTVAHITACSCVNMREAITARMTAYNINVALNVHLRDLRRP